MTWLVAPVILAGLVVIAIGGGSPENRNPVSDGSDAALSVPAACVVTARRSYHFPTVAHPTVAWGQLIGRILLVIAAVVGLLFIAVIVLALLGVDG